ncbi:MAG: glucose sorbosone dehydrogenase, partial [Actinomycetota bacterium]
MRRALTAAVVAVVGLLIAAGCGADEQPTVDGLTPADGFVVEQVTAGLDGPTQATPHPDGRLVVAELNGEENGGTGRVLAVDDDGAVEVLVTDLFKPTGVAVVGDELWILEPETLSRAPLSGGRPVPVVEGMVNNGRSQTTLTVGPDGALIYGTSGSLRGGGVVEGSGVLWSLDPDLGLTAPVASGFKNAYGHTYDDEGRLWVTEVSDGGFDGSDAPDELVAVVAGADHGWPRCVGDRVPVAEFGGAASACQS